MKRCKTLLCLAALGAVLVTGGWTFLSPSGAAAQEAFQDSGFYRLGDTLAEAETGIPQEMISYAANKFTYVYDTFLKDSGSKTYLSLIPTKHSFLADGGVDAQETARSLMAQAPFLENIDLTGLLTLEDYYATDLHWKQENIFPVARKVAGDMGVTLTGEGLTPHTLWGDFKGNYLDNYPDLPIPADRLTLVTSPTLEACTVTKVDLMGRPTDGVLYDSFKARQRYLYDIYLSGPQGLMTLENPAAAGGRELILFRDSFGSSLAPLLAEGYAKITLVDLRYMSSFLLGEYIDFHGQDVLFLYSTLLINNSMALK